MKKTEIIIDLEFTGLDNSYIKDNEIIQLKMINCKNDRSYTANFRSLKKISAYPRLSHKVTRYKGSTFCKDFFNHGLEFLLIDQKSEPEFYGFGVQQDILMLNKYGIKLNIIDIREMLQLTKHEATLATEGSGLEAAYLIVTGKHPELKNHDGIDELKIIKELFLAARKLRKKEYLTVMPHGHCAGMPLKEYISGYRRAADGYRYNNFDILSKSLSNIIEEEEPEFEEDYD